MTIINHTLGFPRVGLRRELKKAQESYWAGNATREELLAVGRELRARHWEQQKQAGIDLLPVGDFAWYDHVLTTSLLLGNVPARHQNKDGSVDIDTLFRIGAAARPPASQRPPRNDQVVQHQLSLHGAGVRARPAVQTELDPTAG